MGSSTSPAALRDRANLPLGVRLRNTIIRAAVLFAAAFAMAGLLLPSSPISAINDQPRRTAPRGPAGDAEHSGFGFAGMIGLPGVVLTFFYLRQPYGWMRTSYRALLAASLFRQPAQPHFRSPPPC